MSSREKQVILATHIILHVNPSLNKHLMPEWILLSVMAILLPLLINSLSFLVYSWLVIDVLQINEGFYEVDIFGRLHWCNIIVSVLSWVPLQSIMSWNWWLRIPGLFGCMSVLGRCGVGSCTFLKRPKYVSHISLDIVTLWRYTRRFKVNNCTIIHITLDRVAYCQFSKILVATV